MPPRLQRYMNRNYEFKGEEHPYENLIKNGNPINLFMRTTIIYGVYFICCIGAYKEIIADQMASLSQSGLMSKTRTIFCFICNYNDEVMDVLEPYLSKLKIISTTENLYERFALENFKTYTPKGLPYYLFYFHTKGVSRDIDKQKVFHERRKNLDYFILERYDSCIFWLDRNYDAVGTSLSLFPSLHFSGNFWWAKSSHLDCLPTKLKKGYLAPEMYICSAPNGKYISVCQSTNHKVRNDYVSLSGKDILKQSTCVPIYNRACKSLK